MHNLNRRRGFTLIELLIVIAIIGILAGAVVVSLGGETDEAANATLKLSIASAVPKAIIEETKDHTGSQICDNVAAAIPNNAITVLTFDGEVDGIDTEGNIGCMANGDSWVLIGRGENFDGDDNTNDHFWCADHTGFRGGIVDEDDGTDDIVATDPDNVDEPKCQ